MKTCKTCGIVKREAEFYRREGTCYECKKARLVEWQKNNKEKVAQYAKNWRRNNPEAAKASWSKAKHKRRVKSAHTSSDLNVKDWKQTLKYFQSGCAVCSEKENVQIDHFVPVASGNGDTSVTNVIPLCRYHNVSKRDKHPIIWLQHESGASQEVVERIVFYLAKMNGMSSAEFESHVSDLYYGSGDADRWEYGESDCDLSLDDVDNFIYDDDDWYLTMLEGRKGGRH